MPSRATRSLLRRLLGEPTVVFALLAAALFAAAAVVKSQRREIIDIDIRAVERRIREIERGRATSLSEEERRLAESAYIDEQVLARAARAGGFDDDDRIRSILYQKMLHILSGEAVQPTHEQLRAFYDANRQRYGRPPTVTVDEIEVAAGGETPPAELKERAREARPGGEGRRVLTRVSEDELSWTYGAATAARMFGAEVGKWIGPYASGGSTHWFRVTGRFEPTPAPPFESVLGQVRFDWVAEKEKALLDQRVAELRSRYLPRFIGERSSR
jgi:hypothetical protein